MKYYINYFMLFFFHEKIQIKILLLLFIILIIK